MPADRVLVVGGGIAGLSCAIAMRAHGFVVDVVELHDRVSPDSLILRGRAVDALSDLGILGQCTSRASTQYGSLFRNVFNAAGKRLDLPRPQQPRNGLPTSMWIFRPTLLEVLWSTAQAAGAKIRQPCTVDSIVQFPDSVLVSFNDNTTAEYELVVGADGLHSRVRNLLWGNDVEPVYTGSIGIRWLAGHLPVSEPGFYYAPGNVVVVGKLPNDQTYLATFAVSDEMTVTQDRARALLCGVLDAYTAPYLHMLRERVDDTQAMVTRPWEWLWAPEWYRGRVVLIGDAAHGTAPYVPTGAGMALIDSVILAEELTESDDITSGLAAYVHRRQERARLVVQTSVEVTRLHQAGRSSEATTVLMSAMRMLAPPY